MVSARGHGAGRRSAEEILATANQCGSDLIVLGVRGLDALTGGLTEARESATYRV